MDSLESRLERLSPEQRRQVEDFVDFLLQRSFPQSAGPAAIPPASPAPALAAAPPVLSAPESVPDPQLLRVTSFIGNPEPARPAHEADPATLLIQEIASEKEDILTAEYLDYGRFDRASPSPPSPATEAVQRVKAKLSGKKVRDPVQDVLEWID